MDLKNTLRREINNRIKAFNNFETASKKISKNLKNLQEWNKCNKVFLFISFKNEVDTRFILEMAKKEGKMVFAPLISNKNMDFYRVDNLRERDLVINNFGIKEPPKGLPPVFPDDKTLFIVPGLGFSTDLKRLGRGGGFYDRYFKRFNINNRVAIAFSCQMVEDIPTDEWDEKVDIIVTEKLVYGGL